MQASEVRRAVAAAVSVAGELDLGVADATVVHSSNRLAVRLLPCDVLARVHELRRSSEAAASSVRHGLVPAGPAFEVEVARHLGDTDSPIALLEPRVEPGVYERDGFAVTFWSFYESVPPHEASPREYADALASLHAGMRPLDVRAPHFTDRVAEAQWKVADRSHTPELGEADRELLDAALRNLRRTVSERGAAEQLLHGEPHPGNLLRTDRGLRFIDLETCCRGPVEFDIAHAPDAVAEHYPAVDHELLRACRLLVLAMITTWRWEHDDELPNGRELGREWLDQLRTEIDAR
jgi:hypothetical protein